MCWINTSEFKPIDQELINQLVAYLGEDYRDRLNQASLEESLCDFLDHMEAYGYWDPFKWHIENLKAFKEAFEKTY